MNLLNFIAQYPDEGSYQLKYKEVRDKVGIICSVCGCKEHYWKKDKWQYECKSCRKRTTLRSGSVMHGSQLPFSPIRVSRNCQIQTYYYPENGTLMGGE